MPAQAEPEGGERGALKVIHGQGRDGGASRIKPQVLAALQKHAERLGAVMEQDCDILGEHPLRFGYVR